MKSLCEGCKFATESYGSPYCLANQETVTNIVKSCDQHEANIPMGFAEKSLTIKIPQVKLPKRHGVKRPVFYGIALRLIGLCLMGMFATFITEQWQVLAFFGDQYVCHEAHGILRCHSTSWGTRHYWYAWTMGILFCLALLDVVVGVVLVVRSSYETKNWG